MDVERIKEIKERLTSATPGEWGWESRLTVWGPEWIVIDNLNTPVACARPGHKPDGIFVANAKADIEFLLGALVQAFEDGVNYEQSEQIWENSVYVDYEQPEPPYWLQVVQ